MAKKSAGLLLYRQGGQPEIFLVHPGGPFWAHKDFGVWSLPKGEFTDGEDPLDAAKREFAEETGCTIDGEFLPLAPLKQRSGKVIYVWAIEGDCNPAEVRSSLFSMEWPPKSGRRQEFPEVDRAAWFDIPEARRRVIAGQVGFIDQLASALGVSPSPEA